MSDHIRVIQSEKVARIEGNASINVTIDGMDVKDVQMVVHEGPRLVEEIVKGKSINEVISITPRICAICNISHKIASTTAMKHACKIELPPIAKYMQKLMHMGEIIESHTLHIYLLVLPDLFKQPSAVHLLPDHAQTVTEGLIQKKFGNKLMHIAGGDRMIHGENPQPGGFSKYPDVELLRELVEEAKELLPKAIRIVELLGPMKFDRASSLETQYLCILPDDENYGFIGNYIITSNGVKIPGEYYKDIIKERLVPHSYAKRSLMNDKPFTVGALARILLQRDRLTGTARSLFSKYYHEDWDVNPMYINTAQAIENVFALEHVVIYAEKMIELYEQGVDLEVLHPETTTGRGVGIVEAPRGLLVHDYTLKDGLLQDANIITPTAMNLDDIEAHLKIATRNMLMNYKEDHEIQFSLEMISRAYDPCISCSAHLINIIRE
ncbi:MAG: Ni/Fe hydrogenase subunit alpha [Candidatus Heimdallarchaeota archaeon]|nr:Ni/Fe hydrogenase subunit alpha [Candidatus Heimdallarchaeota archaeon]